MMMNVRSGTDKDVVKRLKTMKGVKEVYEVYAVYDIVAIIEAPTMTDLNRLVNTDVRKIESVTSTHTIIAERYP